MITPVLFIYSFLRNSALKKDCLNKKSPEMRPSTDNFQVRNSKDYNIHKKSNIRPIPKGNILAKRKTEAFDPYLDRKWIGHKEKSPEDTSSLSYSNPDIFFLSLSLDLNKMKLTGTPQNDHEPTGITRLKSLNDPLFDILQANVVQKTKDSEKKEGVRRISIKVKVPDQNSDLMSRLICNKSQMPIFFLELDDNQSQTH